MCYLLLHIQLHIVVLYGVLCIVYLMVNTLQSYLLIKRIIFSVSKKFVTALQYVRRTRLYVKSRLNLPHSWAFHRFASNSIAQCRAKYEYHRTLRS